MKFVKGISLFFVYPVVMLGIGFVGGIYANQFFYPGTKDEEILQARVENNMQLEESEIFEEDYQQVQLSMPSTIDLPNNAVAQEEVADVALVPETLNADTDYILKEMDLVRKTVVETAWNIPQKYIGMNREQFLTAMEEYEANPPLSEKERGFVGLNVETFSVEKVVVQMNYEYVQPSESFYLAVMDNEIVALLEDKKTIYINTGILLEELPGEVQLQVIEMLYMESEEELYDFLETYSS